ncbi:MAG: ATP-binding protein [candidate division WS1 bacterium]|jgi:anti-sigma regulatory factor (Ser/Thr protein kinase)|nr:ATP-binding protein [candidate division WS1 bacterium]
MGSADVADVLLDRAMQVTLADVPALVSAAGTAAREAGLSDARALRVELAVEEAAVNICAHTYSGSPGPLRLRMFRQKAALLVELTDEGEAFNPLEAPPPDLAADLADRQIGGLGVEIIRRFADSACYERRGACNVLTLTFDLAA